MLLEKINDEKIEYAKELQEPKELIFGLFKIAGLITKILILVMNYLMMKILFSYFKNLNF